ncbi:MAG: hypothetical protein NVS9B15_12910 [Acidobacteriaceae bacterium]
MDPNQKLTAASTDPLSVPQRLSRWLDSRTGVHQLVKKSLDEPIPGGARLAYVFGSGLLFLFISQIITGLCLALYYVPSAETAHTSVAYITKQVAAGAFLRSLHSYGSSAMIIVLALHFFQTFLYGSFKGRRELLWISGAVLSLLVLGMGFTGYLLPWDQKAYFATAIGTNIVGEVPLLGNWLTRMLRGGDTIGTLTVSRFYVAHVFLIPAAIFLFSAAHIALFRKAGPAALSKKIRSSLSSHLKVSTPARFSWTWLSPCSSLLASASSPTSIPCASGPSQILPTPNSCPVPSGITCPCSSGSSSGKDRV